jgi:hypothetical protein
MDLLRIHYREVVTPLGVDLLYDGRTLVFMCRQILLKTKQAIIDQDDVLVVEGARVLLRNLPKSGKIDLSPSFSKGHGRAFQPETQQEYLQTFDFLGVCSIENEDIVITLEVLPGHGHRWFNAKTGRFL